MWRISSIPLNGATHNRGTVFMSEGFVLKLRYVYHMKKSYHQLLEIHCKRFNQMKERLRKLQYENGVLKDEKNRMRRTAKEQTHRRRKHRPPTTSSTQQGSEGSPCSEKGCGSTQQRSEGAFCRGQGCVSGGGITRGKPPSRAAPERPKAAQPPKSA